MEQPNIEYILKLAGNDKKVQLKLIGILKYELPIEIQEYQASISLNKIEAAALCVHKIKHKIGLLGMGAAYQLVEKYENELAKNEKKLQPEFENILKIISIYVNCL